MPARAGRAALLPVVARRLALNDARAATDNLWRGLKWAGQGEEHQVSIDRSTTLPPRWAESLLRLPLSPRDRDGVSGDLLEESRESVVPPLGRGADGWYLCPVSGYLLRATWMRVPWSLRWRVSRRYRFLTKHDARPRGGPLRSSVPANPGGNDVTAWFLSTRPLRAQGRFFIIVPIIPLWFLDGFFRSRLGAVFGSV